MGSSDEEEMRRVRTARGFKTKGERATAATAVQGTATFAAAAGAEASAAVVTARLRRAARRAAAEAASSSSSSDDEKAAAGGRRRAAARSTEAATEEPGGEFEAYLRNYDCRSAGIESGTVTQGTVPNTPFTERATGVCTAAAAQQQQTLHCQKLPSGLQSQPLTLASGLTENSRDKKSCPASRPVAALRSILLDSGKYLGTEKNSAGWGNAITSISDTSSSSCGSSCNSSSSDEKEDSQRREESSLCAKKTASDTIALDAASEVARGALETNCELPEESHWKKGKPSSADTRLAAEDEEVGAEEADKKGEVEVRAGGGRGGEDGVAEEDFLFDQIPENESGESAGAGLTPYEKPHKATQPLPHSELMALRRREGQSSGLYRRQQEDGTQDEEERQHKSLLYGEKQERNWQREQQHEKETEQQGGEKLMQHHDEEVLRGAGADSGDEKEEDVSNIERERRALGLPVAFGCSGGAASQGYAARDAYIKRYGAQLRSSTSATDRKEGAEPDVNEEAGGSSSVAVNDEEEGEAHTWRSVGLPVSLEVDIPAHPPVQVSALAVNLKANRMATGGSDGRVRLWDFQGLHLDSLRSYRSFCPAEKHKVEALAFSFRNDLLLVAAGDAVCRVYTAQAAELVHTTTRGDMYIRDAANTKGHTHTVLDCCWHPLQAQQFFSCGLDSTVRLWDLNAKPYGILQTLPHVTCFKTIARYICSSGRTFGSFNSSSTACCTCCVVAPTAADCLVVGCADGSLQLWGSLSSRRVFGRPDGVVRDAHSVSATPATAAKAFANSAAAESVSITLTASANRLARDGKERTTGLVHPAADGLFFRRGPQMRATAAAAETCPTSNKEEEAEKAYGVSAVRFYSDDRRLVSRGEDGSVCLWDIRKFKQPVARVTVQVHSGIAGRGGLCLSPDDRYVCVTTQEREPSTVDAAAGLSGGALQVLRADELSHVATLPIGRTSLTVNSKPATADSVFTGSTPAAGATAQKLEEEAGLEGRGGRERENSCSISRETAGRCQARHPLRVLWPAETNQLLVGCSDGSVCVLFDREISRKGILLSVEAAKGSRRRQGAAQEAGLTYVQPIILVPGQLPEGLKETRDGQIIRVRPRGKERHRLFLEKQKTLIPPMPAKEGYAGTNVGGGNRSQHLLRQLGLLNPPAAAGEDDDDPIAALRAYAEKTEAAGRESQLISRAYAATQPRAVLDFGAEEEEAAIVAAVASGAVEESSELLRQRPRCPRCALRMCQCGYIDEQNAAAGPTNKRQRV